MLSVLGLNMLSRLIFARSCRSELPNPSAALDAVQSQRWSSNDRKMRLQKSPRTWPSSAEIDTESDVYDTEPLLSDASIASRRSFGATNVFPNASETSDVDATTSKHKPKKAPPIKGLADEEKGENKAGLSRFRYYSKLKNFIKREDTEQALPGGESDGKQSSIVTIFAIWNTVVGSSLLALPWGIDRAGFITGLVLLLCMGALCLYTAYLLLKVDKLHNDGNTDWDVSNLANELLGKHFEFIAKLFSLAVLFGAAIVYWVLMTNFLFYTVDFFYAQGAGILSKNNGPDPIALCPTNATSISKSGMGYRSATYQSVWSQTGTAPLFLILLVGPLVNFKSPTFFTKFNSFGTFSVMYLILFVIIKASGWGFNISLTDQSSPAYVATFSWSFFALTGMLALALFIHNIVITLMRNNRNQNNNTRDLSIAFSLVVSTYFIVGVFFYSTFPLKKSCIPDNLLNNFVNWDPMTVAARLFLFFQLLTVYPLITFMIRVQLFNTIFHKPYPGLRYVLLLNGIIITLSALFAIFLPKIGTIIRFTGALSGFICVFTMPPLLYLKSQQKRGELTFLSLVFHSSIVVFGLVNAIAQFFV